MKVKLLITSSLAKPGSVGAVLGQRGINANDFCKQYNHQSTNILKLKDGFKIAVRMMVDEDGDYLFEISHPQMASLIVILAKYFSRQAIYELANLCLVFEERKRGKNTSFSIKSRTERLKELCKQIIGTARSLKVTL